MIRALAWAIVALWLAMPIAGVAQTSSSETAQQGFVLKADGSPDYTAWNTLADRVEAAVEVGRASDKVLTDLRSEVADWRGLFSRAQEENSIRINTLKTQLATLGAEPENPGDEPAVLTQRRGELTRELNAAQLPVQEAEEGYSRADILIGEIDSLLRTRQTDALFELGPSPLNPSLWPRALSDLKTSLGLAVSEVQSAWGSDVQRKDFRADLPLTLLLLIIALVLLTRSRAWIMRLGAYARSRRKGPTRGVVGFLMSLGQVIAPLVGLGALIEALNLSGILGLRGQALVDALPALGLALFLSLWIGTRLFNAEGAQAPIVALAKPTHRAEARVNVALLGTLVGVWIMLRSFARHEHYSQSTSAVLAFPILVLAGVLLVRFGRLLRRHVIEQRNEETGLFRGRLVALIGRACEIIGFAAPVAAAIGYFALAGSTLFPTVMTLGLIALLAILSRFIRSAYGLLRGLSDDEAQQALLPVLITSLLVLASLPLFALIWGARATDLSELWGEFLQGFQLGDARVTPENFLVFAGIFVVGYVATRAVQSALRTSILPKTQIDKGGQNAISVGVGYLGLFLAALIAISSAGIDLSSIAIIAGALSVGIGFGLQTIVSNFVSGIILLIERPISEGDWIEVGGQTGYVRDISVRSTRIETFDRTDVILPNSDLISGVVTNYTRGNSIGRVIVPVGVAYGTDTKRVERILREIAEAHPMVTVTPAPAIVFQGFGADSLDFEIRAILSDVNFMLTVKSDLNHEIARRFADEEIEIPFAQRDVWLRNPEALSGAGAATEPEISQCSEPLPVDAMTTEDLPDSAEPTGGED